MKRHPANPLITPEMVRPSAPGFRVRGVFNPAAARMGDEILLLVRVAEDCEATADEGAGPRRALGDRRRPAGYSAPQTRRSGGGPQRQPLRRLSRRDVPFD